MISESTGTIKLDAQETEEFFNECHGEADGKFCGGSKGGGGGKGKSNKERKGTEDAFGLYIIAAYVAVGVVFIVAPTGKQIVVAKLKERQVNKKVSKEAADKLLDASAKWRSQGIIPGSGKRPFRLVEKATGLDRWGLPNRLDVDGVKCKAVYEIEALDGTKLRLYDTEGKNSSFLGKLRGKDTIKHEDMLNTLAFAHESSPLDGGPPKLILTNTTEGHSAYGWTIGQKMDPKDRAIWINSDWVTPPGDKVSTGFLGTGIGGDEFPGWNMPASKGTTRESYTILHEYGHRFDYDMDRGNAVHIFEQPQIQRHLSGYATSNKTTMWGEATKEQMPYEGYAEAFADWHGSSGTSRNPSTLAYADFEGWHGTRYAGTAFDPSDGLRRVRTPEGARRYGISIGQVISELELPKVVSASGRKNDMTRILQFAKVEKAPMIYDGPDGARVDGEIEVKVLTEKEKINARKAMKDFWTELELDDAE